MQRGEVGPVEAEETATLDGHAVELSASPLVCGHCAGPVGRVPEEGTEPEPLSWPLVTWCPSCEVQVIFDEQDLA